MSQTPSLDLIHHHLTDFDPAASMKRTLGVRARHTLRLVMSHQICVCVHTHGEACVSEKARQGVSASGYKRKSAEVRKREATWA